MMRLAVVLPVALLALAGCSDPPETDEARDDHGAPDDGAGADGPISATPTNAAVMDPTLDAALVAAAIGALRAEWDGEAWHIARHIDEHSATLADAFIAGRPIGPLAVHAGGAVHDIPRSGVTAWATGVGEGAPVESWTLEPL